MSGGPKSKADDTEADDKEEDSSMGKVVFLEAEVYRLRAALERLGHSPDGLEGADNSSRRPVVPAGSIMSLAQRPLQPQLAISGNAGSMLDAAGHPINFADPQQFMQHGISDVGIPFATQGTPAHHFSDVSTEVFTPYGVFPQSLGNITSPSTCVLPWSIVAETFLMLISTQPTNISLGKRQHALPLHLSPRKTAPAPPTDGLHPLHLRQPPRVQQYPRKPPTRIHPAIPTQQSQPAPTSNPNAQLRREPPSNI